MKHSADDSSGPLSPMAVPAQKQLKYTAGIANGPRGTAVFTNQQRKVIPLMQYACSCASCLYSPLYQAEYGSVDCHADDRH